MLDVRIASRVAMTTAEHAYWPCKEGCDHCCRSLPRLPEVSAPEWERMEAALAALPIEVRDPIARRTQAEVSAPVTCPFLDLDRGACRIYEARPIACRTYGFYTERDAGLHCGKVTSAIEAHTAGDEVTWGNGEAIGRELDALGERRSIALWLSDVPRAVGPEAGAVISVAR